MAKDKIEDRYRQKEKQSKLDGLFKRTVDPDILADEEQMLADAEKVQPIEAETRPARNDPCPCGSGKKYKKCCGLKKK